MKLEQQVYLDSPLVVPELNDIYRRVIMALPHKDEIFEMGLLEAQGWSSRNGMPIAFMIMMFCDAIDSRVMHEWAMSLNKPILEARVVLENEIFHFVKGVGLFYSNQLKFQQITTSLLKHYSYLMVVSVNDTDVRAQYVVTKVMELTNEQLSRRYNTDEFPPHPDF